MIDVYLNHRGFENDNFVQCDPSQNLEPRYFNLKKLSAKILKVSKFALKGPVPESVFVPTQEK